MIGRRGPPVDRPSSIRGTYLIVRVVDSSWGAATSSTRRRLHAAAVDEVAAERGCTELIAEATQARVDGTRRRSRGWRWSRFLG